MSTNQTYHDPLAGGPLVGLSVYDVAWSQLLMIFSDPPTAEELAHAPRWLDSLLQKAREDGRFRDPCRDN